MKIKMILVVFFTAVSFSLIAQQSKNSKVVLITLDGFRWQELFTGADPLLVANTKYVNDTTDLKNLFWRKTAEERRKTLLPFLWSKVAEIGQIHGNRKLGSKVNLTNKMWFSYPGYSEILTGMADDARITSNEKFNNPNKTVLEIANSNARYKDKVAAFGSWDVFPYIVNEERSGVPVNAGFEKAKGNDLTEREKFLNDLMPKVPSPWSTVRLDAFTHYYALETMKKDHPELVYIAYGETDDFAHDGEYDAYLKSAYATDTMIKEIWDYTQQDPFYKDNTLFIISTDHGRGTDPLDTWRGHGEEAKKSGEVWMILFGSGVSAKGEVTTNEKLKSSMIAPTVLKALNINIDDKIMKDKPVKL